MSDYDFINDQEGEGPNFFEGYQYHDPVVLKGNGFFGRIIKGGLIPLVKKVGAYLGLKAKDQFLPVLQDLASETNLKTTMKRAGKRVAKSMLRDAADKIDSTEDQRGEGLAWRNFSAIEPGLVTVKCKKAKTCTKAIKDVETKAIRDVATKVSKRAGKRKQSRLTSARNKNRKPKAPRDTSKLFN